MSALCPARLGRRGSNKIGPQQSQADQIEELLMLEALQRERMLTHAESERLGLLVLREQRRARYRPGRIKRLRAELELLEALELAEKGVPEADPVDLVRGDDGRWGVERAEAA